MSLGKYLNVVIDAHANSESPKLSPLCVNCYKITGTCGFMGRIKIDDIRKQTCDRFEPFNKDA